MSKSRNGFWDIFSGNSKNPVGTITTTDSVSLDPSGKIPVGQLPSPIGDLQYDTATGQILITDGSGSSTSFQDLLDSFNRGMSKEEKEELAVLRQEHIVAIKAEKINHFKKLPSDMRQFIVNTLSWKETVGAINSISLDKSLRLKYLEQIEGYSNMFGGVSSVNGFTSNSASLSNLFGQAEIPLPEGISAEELKRAHLEACLEEEMLDEAT